MIIPVFNRPGEVEELLESLRTQRVKPEEIIIVEDGSTETCESVANSYKAHLPVSYFYKENSGPGLSRNYGCEQAKGNFFLFLDSDCVLPADYIKEVKAALAGGEVDAFGGPDRAHRSFSRIQKAINFSMTSFFTTGGIRGGSEKLGKFQPRSFNMGFSREVFQSTGGFSGMRFGEDIDLSIRILKNGFKIKLVREAFVYHKRRTHLRQFFKQVYNSGIARINLYKRHPGSLNLVHFAPALFTLGTVALLVLSLSVSRYFLAPILLHLLLLFLSASLRNRSVLVGILSLLTSYTQLVGYGTGFIMAFWRRVVLGKDEFAAFRNTFYK